MHPAHEQLRGINRDRLLAVLEPILRAHGVEPVECLWRTERGGRVLHLTVERPGATEPGAGVTLDLCSEISRDLSVALDVADVLPGSYRLEVGSPGVERVLYSPQDYARFAGHAAKIKLREVVDGQKTFRGLLKGLDDAGRVVLETDTGELCVEPARIETGQLVFDWQRALGNGQGAPRTRRRKRAAQRSR